MKEQKTLSECRRERGRMTERRKKQGEEERQEWSIRQERSEGLPKEAKRASWAWRVLFWVHVSPCRATDDDVTASAAEAGCCPGGNYHTLPCILGDSFRAIWCWFSLLFTKGRETSRSERSRGTLRSSGTICGHLERWAITFSVSTPEPLHSLQEEATFFTQTGYRDSILLSFLLRWLPSTSTF